MTDADPEETGNSRQPSIAGRFDYYVTLDLGSESMAACLQHRDGRVPIPIHLQWMAPVLLSPGVDKKPPQLLKEEGEDAPSSRLRTRISLEGGHQPKPLPATHAVHKLERDDHTTLFGFFHPAGMALGKRLLPNPKLLYQTGVKKIIPEIEADDGTKVIYEPAELLEHLTGQVLQNFVLDAPELAEEARLLGGSLDLRRVHLTITIPNVYSLTHARSLEEFVQRNFEFGGVCAMYESDAVAHFMLAGPLPDDPEEIRTVKLRISESLGKRAGRDREGEGCIILTIDIGKGTTDLSLFNYHQTRQQEGSVLSHDVAARTGRSHGGVRLSRILAGHFEARIGEVLDRNQRDPNLAAAITRQRPLVSLLSQPGWPGGRGVILTAAEELIEALKRHFDEDYHLTLSVPAQRRLARSLAQTIRTEIGKELHGLSLATAGTLASPAAGGEGTPSDSPVPTTAGLDRLQNELEQALLLPLDLPRQVGGFGLALREWLSRWATRLRGSKYQPPTPGRTTGRERAPFVKLRRELEDYVRANVDDPLLWLEEMATAREKTRQSPLGRSAEVFVIVAGQASQFAPIQRAIRRWARDHRDLTTEHGDLLFLRGKLAKFACCYGAQWFFRNAVQTTNPNELLGSYGLLKSGAPIELIQLDMERVNRQEAVPVQLMAGDYWLIFQPRHPAEVASLAEIDAILRSGAVAYIRTISLPTPGTVEFRYGGPEEGIRCRLPGGSWEKLATEATFGDLEEDIYQKTWPEALPDAPY